MSQVSEGQANGSDLPDDFPLELLLRNLKTNIVLLLDQDFKIVYCNHDHFLEYLKIELIGMKLDNLIDEDPELITDKTLVLKYRDKNQKAHHFQTQLIKHGESNLLICQTESGLVLKSEIMANMSHEIRNPLQAIFGAEQLLESTKLDHEQKEYVHIIEESSFNLLSIINDMLDVNKLEAGQVDLRLKPFSVRRCIEDSIDLIMPKASQKHITVSLNSVNCQPKIIISDYNRLKQVVINLLSNAVKFTHENGKVDIKVESKYLCEYSKERLPEKYQHFLSRLERKKINDDDNSHTIEQNLYKILEHSFYQNPQCFNDPIHVIKISIKDSGIGIKEEDFGRLFNSYIQLDQSSTKSYQGTGLGLAICRELVHLLGGDVWVEESKPDQGSTFSFNFIAQEINQDELSVNYKEILNNKNILVVDDNPVNRISVSNLLLSLGTRPTICSSANEAMIFIKNNYDFDLGLIDIQMPNVDGYELAKKIKEINPLLPLIGMSSLGENQTPKLDDQTDTFSSYLIKPIRSSRLISNIIFIFNNHRVREQSSKTGINLSTCESINNYFSCSDDYSRSSSNSLSSTSSSSNDSPLILNYDREKIHILIVEDIDTNCRILTSILHKMGFFNLDYCNDGQTALKKVDQQLEANTPYELYLLDIKMPKMSGITLARLIREKMASQPQLPPVKMIAISGAALKEEKEYFMSQNLLDEYLTKPIDMFNLQITIDKLCGGVDSPTP